MIKTVASVKADFETGDKPTESDFGDLVDIIPAVPVSAIFPCVIEVLATASTTSRVLGAVGVQLIESSTTSQARGVLDITDVSVAHSTFGIAMASASNTAAGQGVIGGGTVGIQVFEAATTASAQQALNLEGAGSVVHTTFGIAMASAVTTAAGQLVLGGGTAGIAIFEAATTASVESQLPTAGTWVLIGTTVAASSASLIVTGLDSTYDSYAIGLSDLIPETDNTNAYMRLGDSGGVDAGAADYASVAMGMIADSNTFAIVGVAGSAAAQMQLTIAGVGNAAGEGFGGMFFLSRPGDGVMRPGISGTSVHQNTAPNATFNTAGGNREAVITVDRIEFLFASGSVQTGRMSVWGISHG